MCNSIQRDSRRRRLVLKYQFKRLEYKSIGKDLSLSEEMRAHYMHKLTQLPRNSSPTRVRNRCVLTGRGRGVYKLFKLSRIRFRELASMGSLPGVTKASW